MAFWFLLLFFPILAVAKSQPITTQTNQTDLQAAMSDMRKLSYHGFVILLKILNSTSSSVRDREITFLMPNDEELSKVSLSQDRLQDFILSHSIPTPLVLSHLLHFPNGTLVPSNVQNKMLSITNGGRTGIFVNNAKIVVPNVCLNSLVRCHGISTTIAFGSTYDSPLKLHRRNAKSASVHVKKTPALQ